MTRARRLAPMRQIIRMPGRAGGLAAVIGLALGLCLVPIRQVAAFDKEQKPIPWVRLYKLPDFVFFSHSVHLNGKVACAECHGPVEQREALAAEVTHNMKTCMACHSAREVSNKCHICHELGQ